MEAYSESQTVGVCLRCEHFCVLCVQKKYCWGLLGKKGGVGNYAAGFLR
jgi:hypothetical protein